MPEVLQSKTAGHRLSSAGPEAPERHSDTVVVGARPRHPARRALVGEQIDVLGGPGDDPVGQQRVAAAQRGAVPGRRGQRDGGDLAMQVTDRASGRRGRGGPQLRMMLLPGLPHAFGQGQLRPHRDQRVLVQVTG
jgi:hypothetical protein